MTEHATCYETLSSRDSAGGGFRSDSTFTQKAYGVVANAGFSDPIPYPVIPPSAHGGNICQHMNFIWKTDTPTQSLGVAQAAADVASLNGATVDNGGIFMITIDALGSSGRLSPRVQMAASGAYATALAALAGTPTTVDFILHHAYVLQSYQGLRHFVEFEDHPPDQDTDGSIRSRALLQQISQSSNTYPLGITSGGVAIIAKKCGFAALAPEGVVYIEPGDLGPNNEQIPESDFTANTAARFRFHPSVFYPAGRTNYVRSVGRRFSDSIDIVTSPQASEQPIGIVTVDNAITASNWMVLVDGVPQLLNVVHPVGSDLRRPRDIWNTVWVPILAGSQNLAAAVSYRDVFAGVPVNQGTIASRLQYADYFRCLGLPGSFHQQSTG